MHRTVIALEASDVNGSLRVCLSQYVHTSCDPPDKVFRIKFMKDLRLMVKGLIAGIRTLTLAFLLLFAVLYVISGFATMTIGSDTRTKELELEEYFYNIPAAMFTAFRCFNGECVNRRGEPINFLLADAFGLPFGARL